MTIALILITIALGLWLVRQWSPRRPRLTLPSFPPPQFPSFPPAQFPSFPPPSGNPPNPVPSARFARPARREHHRPSLQPTSGLTLGTPLASQPRTTLRLPFA